MSILGELIFGLVLGLLNGLSIWLDHRYKKQADAKNTCKEEFSN